MNYRTRIQAILIALLIAFMGALGLRAPAAPDGVAIAAAPPDMAQGQGIPPQSDETRRESLGPVQDGPARRTGPSSSSQPLTQSIDPIFGANYRANTDTQNPNLAQQEPSIAVNPTNPLNVVAAAKDEREGTNTKHVYIYTSTDGGVTWLNQRFPYLQPIPAYSSDPVVNFSDDGVCYVTSLPYGGGTVGIQIARSNDGCITFSTVAQVTSNPNSDKEWTWVDNSPASPFYHRVYVAWRNFGSGADVVLNYSSDRGATWSADSSAASTAYQFPMPVTLPNGNVLVTFLPSGGVLGFTRSTDGGVTFGPTQNISPITHPNCPPDNGGCGIWRLNPIPATGVNPLNGNLVVVWADGIGGRATTYYSRSADNGATWSVAAPLATSPVANTYQVEPWVEADEEGTFHAIWYDNRETPNTSIFHIYYSQSTDNGATWTQATRISSASSDLRIGIPPSYNLAAGDYIQVTASHGNVYAAWTDTRSGTGEDIYVVRGTYGGGTVTPTSTGVPSTSTAIPTQTLIPVPTSTTIPPLPTASRTSTTVPAATHTAVVPSPTLTQIPSSPTTPPSPTLTPCAIVFTDVPPDNTFYDNIRCLACRDVMGGYSDGTFRPYNDITRGQIAKIAANAARIYDDPGAQMFEDVPPGSTFYVFINRLARRGYIGGYPCGQRPTEPCIPGNRPYFRPNEPTTRGQFAQIVDRTANLGEPVSGQFYTDVPNTNPFYVGITRLSNRGVMSGYPCGGAGEPCDAQNRPYFRWAANVTRGQASKIVANTFYPSCQTP